MTALPRSTAGLALLGLAAALPGGDSAAESRLPAVPGTGQTARLTSVAPAAAQGLASRAAEASASVEQALSAADRPAEDRALDAARKPAELVGFLGITSGMTVLDANSGGGYYSEVLAAAVGPAGKVVSQNPEFILDLCEGNDRDLSKRLSGNRLPNVERRDISLETVGPDHEFDAALLNLTLHGLNNMDGEKGVMRNLSAIFRVLKPGGVFGVIDHVGLPNTDYKPLYRIDPEVAEQFVTAAGFEIEARSDLLANPADDHTRIVLDPMVKGNTDRFLLRARKPSP
jgi:predicted methyltransferase